VLFRTVLALATLFAAAAIARAQDCAPDSPGPPSLRKQAEVIFVGTLASRNSETLRFQISEAFKGTRATTFDLMAVGPPISRHFDVGEPYIVFADSMMLDGRKQYFAPVCGPTRQIKVGHAIVEQLRAEKKGKHVASVYGTLRRTTDYISSYYDPSFDRPLPGVLVTLKLNDRAFQSRTDSDGVFAFDDLPQGRYQASADLPPGLILASEYFDDPPPAFEMPGHSSYDYDLTALSSARIRGQVVGPDGKPLRDTSVEVYRSDQYSADRNGVWVAQTDGNAFEIRHLPPGDYIIVFNRRNSSSPDGPFARTFYPDAADVQGAKPIHVAEGQQISGADIHLSNPIPTRQIAVKVQWGNLDPAAYIQPFLVVEASAGEKPYPYKTGPDAFTLDLFGTARYTIHGQTFCKNLRKGEVVTEDAVIDGGDSSISSVALTFAGHDCSAK
jgi:hypothetical protein